MKSRTLTCMTAMVLFAALAAPIRLAAANPVPLINQPLVPDATARGGAGFTLTVDGTGFVSTSIVNWNGSPLATTFVSMSRLTAAVPASNIGMRGTASVTVVNSGTLGGASNVALFEVTPRNSSTFLSPASDFGTGSNPQTVATGDFNGDCKLDLATANSGGTAVSVLLGNGDGIKPDLNLLSGYCEATGQPEHKHWMDLALPVSTARADLVAPSVLRGDE